ncbi:hypothetical protein [Sphingomonas sp. Leaf257]|uniref:hypothetical protein n=1 Tax=Sphingomonas sp. Leaf257 TaxID=1736309 RepID=UPI0012E14EC9|nr:hypothetical protein [Sphingomonas sp. Leaf257]
MRKLGIQAEVGVSSHGDYPAVFFANGAVKTQLTFLVEQGSAEAYEGFIFESLFPNPVGLDEVDANDWNSEFYYATMALGDGVVSFSRMYPIPSSENSIELLGKLVGHWMASHSEMIRVVLGKS